MGWRCCFCGKKAKILVFGSSCCRDCGAEYITTVMNSLKGIGVFGGMMGESSEESSADANLGFG